MTDFIYFLGRFHVLALHLPIGIIFAAVGLEWLTRGERNHSLKAIAPYLWGLASITAIATVVLGYMHISEGGFEGASADAHRIYGTSIAVITTLVWFLCCKFPSVYGRFKLIFSLILLGLVTVTGHYGGNLTHGSTYLVEYAPNTLRSMAGLDARRPPVENLAMADPYYDVISPMLQQRCSSCHNSDKSRGQYNVANYDATLAGGESGPAIVPNDSDRSELYQRITLSPKHDDYMPADAKTPLTDDQVQLIRWWVDTGALKDVTFADAKMISVVTPEIETLLITELGLGESPAATAQNTETVSADPQIIDGLYQAGFLVRQLTQGDSQLVVSLASPNKKINDQQINSLLQAAEHIAHLNLQGTGLDDQGVNQFGQFTQLTHLRLSSNNLSDAGMNHLAALPKIEHLNLYGNANISDESIKTFTSMSSLSKLFLWQTGITTVGVKELQEKRPELAVQSGATN